MSGKNHWSEWMDTSNWIVSIVDDEVDITTLFSDALRTKVGISVVCFNNPIIALEHFNDNKENYARL